MKNPGWETVLNPVVTTGRIYRFQSENVYVMMYKLTDSDEDFQYDIHATVSPNNVQYNVTFFAPSDTSAKMMVRALLKDRLENHYPESKEAISQISDYM